MTHKNVTNTITNNNITDISEQDEGYGIHYYFSLLDSSGDGDNIAASVNAPEYVVTSNINISLFIVYYYMIY